MILSNLLAIVSDTIFVDTLAQADTIGDVVDDIVLVMGSWVEYIILAALGLLTKLLVDLEKLVQNYVGKLPGPVVAVMAAATAQLVMFVNDYLNVWGGPSLSTDPALLITGISGLVVWLVSMGWHSFLKSILKRKEVQ